MRPIRKTNWGRYLLAVLFLLLMADQDAAAQSVGISSSSITPDASSILELRTTSKGLLIPRLTTTERDNIPAAATGLMIYNTSTGKFNYYNGSAWISLFSGTAGVNSITGTTNRISIGGTASDPVIDISASYAGQNTITTLGTVSTGTWNGSLIGLAYGGTNANLSATGGASQVLMQTSAGGAITVAQLAASNLSNGTTGSNAVVLATSPTLVTPTLGVASLTSGTLTGTAGSGFLELPSQSSAPASGAASSIRLYSNTGALAWKYQSDGFVRRFNSSLTADRTYSLPDSSGTIALSDNVKTKWAPVTKSSNATLTNAENFVLGDCTSGNISLTLPASPTDGQEVVIIKAGTNENAALTVLPNSGQVIGQSQTYWPLTERNHSAIFVYVAASSAWRIAAKSSFSVFGFRKRGTTGARYYTSPSTGTALTTATFAANTLYAMPLVLENAVTIDQMLINVTTQAAGSNVRVGIYDDNNNLPDQLVVDCGAIASTSTGVKTYTTNLPRSLPPGLYWLAAVSSSSSVAIRGFAVAGLIPIMGSDAALGTAQGFGYSVAFTYGALPTTYPASPTVRTAAPLPAIFVRYSD